ncbi:Glycosyltransferase involved in cell wall bisynthesis [Prevotella sp. khp1]|uniref:glycosyltransferase family 2 protein n=1 Tax=Prevotellaceae TaxID=171552 RepID=UPI00088AFD1F|nr:MULTISPECIES: glycosyltransferase family 2 protein [Prevotellaceae]QVJ80689.1 glycosyltransferase family 2 protein [Xylanibacter ruminicola]SDQ15974.1 Glycosyltransferase involved in cell wall bisynthesis [Prevotella sp. khp1]
MGYEVTIGIPVYKSADYIRRSLESALSQTYSSIEFLVVDDAGCDGSLDIVHEIKRTHPRGNDIHLICHQENLGVSASRNQIIDRARGRFLYFMDSDDVITENAIELLMSRVGSYDAEIVFGSYEKIELSGNKGLYQYSDVHFAHKDELATFAYRKYAGIQASSCNFLVKIDILRDNHLRFIDANYWEDMVFTFDLVTYISRAVLLSDVTYSYICRPNSLSHYQHRNTISKHEVWQNVRAIDTLKKTSSLLSNKIYYPNRCYTIAMTDFYIACNILKRRNDIVPYVQDGEIKSLMKHPADFRQVCKFRQSRIKNIILFVVGKLPAFWCVRFIWCVGKLKKLI